MKAEATDDEWTMATSEEETVDWSVAGESGPRGPVIFDAEEKLAQGSAERGGGWFRMFVRHSGGGDGGGGHPWFLVSGLLMFVGCYLVNAAVHDRPDELGPVLGLVGVFMVYEWLVLGLGVWLWRRSAGLGEAGQLLGLAVLLLADTTFVYNELAIADLGLGAGIGVVAGGLGLLKLGIVARVAGVRLGGLGWMASVGGVVMVFGLPVLARAVGGTTGGVPGWVATSAWWAAAVLVSAVLWVLSDPRWRDVPRGGLRGLMVALPTVSAVLHLLAMHWVYNETWTAAHLSPMLLGLSVVLLMRSAWGATLPRAVAGVSGAVGLWSSVGGEVQTIHALAFDLEWSAMRGWLLVAGLAYAAVWWERRSLVLLLVWPTLWALAWLGASPGTVAERVSWGAGEGWRGASAVVPRGLLSWGAMVMGLAFATLGLGAWVSGRRARGSG